MVINNKLSDFLQAARVRHKVSPGCNLYQDQDDEQTDPCHDHKCQHAGQCIANKSYATYECKCVAPFTGRFCEIKRKLFFINNNINIFIISQFEKKNVKDYRLLNSDFRYRINRTFWLLHKKLLLI